MDSEQSLNLIQAMPGCSEHGFGIGAISTHRRFLAKAFHFFAQRQGH
jgi:hypothetical protein